jgi:hypothetical protein
VERERVVEKERRGTERKGKRERDGRSWLDEMK